MNDESYPVFLAERGDGFGGRVNALLNALALAELQGTRCQLVWEAKPSISKWHGVEGVEKIFSPAFIERYVVDRSTFHNAIAFDEYLKSKRNTKKGFDARFVKTGINIPKEIREKYLDSRFQSALTRSYSKIEFHPDLSSIIAQANEVNIKPGAVAIHLRAGDVIYSFRRYVPKLSGRAIPYQIAASVLDKCRREGKDAIIFGQDQTLCRAFATSYGAMYANDLHADQDWTSVQRELFEITLMSRCEQLIGSYSSFLLLAAVIGEREIQNTYHSHSLTERKNLILADDLPPEVLAATSIDQKLFSLWGLAYEMLSLPDCDASELLSICRRALSLAPDDQWLLLLHACVLAKSGAFDEAEVQIALAAAKTRRKAIGIASPRWNDMQRATDLLLPAARAGKPWASAFLLIERGISTRTLKFARNALADPAVASSKWQSRVLDRLKESHEAAQLQERAQSKEINRLRKVVSTQKSKLANLEKKLDARRQLLDNQKQRIAQQKEQIIAIQRRETHLKERLHARSNRLPWRLLAALARPFRSRRKRT